MFLLFNYTIKYGDSRTDYNYLTIPPLCMQGYHIGYNGACLKPQSVPPISRWQHKGTGTEIVLMAEDNYGTMIRAPVCM